MRRILLVLAFAAAWGPGRAAADFYRYETEAGTISYADEASAIPSRYRASAERISGQHLRSYARLTPVDVGARPEPGPLWTAPIEGPNAPARPTHEPAAARLDLGAGAGLELPVTRGTIEVSHKGFWKDGAYRTALVVEQQGEILAVIEQGGSITASEELTLD